MSLQGSQRLLASDGFNLQERFILDPGKGTTVAEEYSTPTALINNLLPNVYIVASILVFVFIFVAGFKIIMNPDSKKGAEESKKSITYAVMGLLILFAAYWIIQIVQVLTGIQILGGTP